MMIKRETEKNPDTCPRLTEEEEKEVVNPFKGIIPVEWLRGCDTCRKFWQCEVRKAGANDSR